MLPLLSVDRPLAHRILLQITSQIRRLDLSHNLLGSEGTLQLIRGLLFCRARFSSPDLMTDSLWGLIEINLANNGVGDEAMAELMVYAKKDVFLEKVFLQGNDLEVCQMAGEFMRRGSLLTLGHWVVPRWYRNDHQLSHIQPYPDFVSHR